VIRARGRDGVRVVARISSRGAAGHRARGAKGRHVRDGASRRVRGVWLATARVRASDESLSMINDRTRGFSFRSSSPSDSATRARARPVLDFAFGTPGSFAPSDARCTRR
jgi:hypothetical protein